MRFIFAFFFISLCFFISCKQQQNVISDYNKQFDKIEVNYKINYNSDSTLRILYSVNTQDLLLQNSKNYKSYFSFEIEQYDELKNVLIHSYNTKIFTAQINPNNAFILGEFKYPYKTFNNNSLRIQMLSNTGVLLNSLTYYFEKNTFKTDAFLFQNNELIDWNQPYYLQDTFIFKNNFIDSIKYLFLSIDSNQYNSIYRINRERNQKKFQKIDIIDGSFNVYFQSIGSYNFYSDTIEMKQYSMFPVVSRQFPLNNTPCEMLNAIAIIDTLINIDSLKLLKTGCKIELDKYWLSICGKDEIKAKNNIREFYNRIAVANKRYTKTVQGMYSDRGICYILFGEPKTTKNFNNKEIWYYNSDTTLVDTKFEFEKINLIVNSDYILNNKESKQLYFEHAMLNWKNGKQFFLKN